MKKALKIGSLILILLGISSIGLIYLPVNETGTKVTPLFASFPANESRVISFSPEEEFEETTDELSAKNRERQRLDQLRDWCMLTIISESGLSPKEVAETIYDLPAIREETLRRVANFEYGETRSRVIGNGKVVALIPANPDGEADTPRASAARRDNLAHIADEQRKNLGTLPEEFIIFEYALMPSENSVRITRRDTLPGNSLFTPLYGYYESEIRNLDDLRTFMETTDDLTYASKLTAALKLGGRKRLREVASGELPYGHIGLEEVAAIWRGQQGLKEFQGCGFSLDPRLDMKKMVGTFESEFAPYLDDKLVSKARDILARKTDKPEEARVKEYEFALTLYSVCDQSNDRSNCLKSLRGVLLDNSYQAARYEGQHLAGTETGMVLFYTDLLMKLWAFDLAQSSPGHDRIPGFPTSGIQVSNIHKNELDRAPESRLWLAPLTSGFQIADEQQSLVFTRNATRVFAHATDLLTGGDSVTEPEPNIFDRMFINWWNDHYEEIARFEPQYERLNGIVKWSVLINWLNEEEQTRLLGFLADNAPGAVTVTRVNYFTEWKDKHPELTFRNWDKIKFDKQADARGENESLDIIKSDLFPVFGGITWEGGVSLANRTAIREAAEASGQLKLLPAATRRVGMDALRSDLAAGRLRTLEATEFTFKNFSDEAVSTLARAKPSARLTNAYGELQNVGFDRTIRSTSDGFLMRMRAEGGKVLGDVGDLRIVRNPGGYKVSWQSRDIDLGQYLGRRLSTNKTPVQFLANHAEVETTIVIDNKFYLVKLNGTDRWIKFSQVGSESTTISKGFQARVSGIGNEAKPVDIAWLDGQAVQSELRNSGYIKINSAKNGSNGVVMECCAQTLPQKTTELLVERGDVKVKAFRGEVDDLYIRMEDIPANLRTDPARLGISGLGPDDLRVARNLEAGQYRELANNLTRDPVAFRNQLNRIMTDQLERNNRLIAQGQFEEALQQTRRLIDIHGKVPELTYREALLEAGSARVNNAAEALNNSIRRPLQNPEKFFNEVEFRLQNTANPQGQANLRRVADYVDWSQYSRKSGEVLSFTKNEQLHLGLRAQSLPRGQAVTAKDLQQAISRGDPVYLPDGPEFANLDVFTTQGEASLRQLISPRRFEVIKVSLDDVGHFRPSMLQELNTNSTWNLANFNPVAIAIQTYVRYERQQCEREDQKCYVYVVRPTSDGGH